jgi:hypothetical protein
LGDHLIQKSPKLYSNNIAEGSAPVLNEIIKPKKKQVTKRKRSFSIVPVTKYEKSKF